MTELTPETWPASWSDPEVIEWLRKWLSGLALKYQETDLGAKLRRADRALETNRKRIKELEALEKTANKAGLNWRRWGKLLVAAEARIEELEATLKNAVELNMLRAHDNAKLVAAQARVEELEKLLLERDAGTFGIDPRTGEPVAPWTADECYEWEMRARQTVAPSALRSEEE